MLSSLASPAVCVVDDEEADYKPILAVLNELLYVSSIHLFKGSRRCRQSRLITFSLFFLIFICPVRLAKMPLHILPMCLEKLFHLTLRPSSLLSGATWETRWKPRVYPEDQETEVQRLSAHFGGRASVSGSLDFHRDGQTKGEDRAEDWHQTLKEVIDKSLQDQSAVEPCGRGMAW